MLEAIDICEEVTGRTLDWTYSEQNRVDDHIWWVSNVGKFQSHYPQWQLTYDVRRICAEIYEFNSERWLAGDRQLENAIG